MGKRTQNKLNFTKAALTKLAAHADKRCYFYDAVTPNLCVSVTPAGVKSFLVYKWLKGKPERVTLGRFPAMTPEQARREATKINAQFAEGKSVMAARHADRDELSFGEAFALYIDLYAKHHTKTWRDMRANFERHFGRWRNAKIGAIRSVNVQQWHAKLGSDNGKYQANRQLELMRAVINWALEARRLERASLDGGENPTIGVKEFKEKSRERFLTAEELPRFFEALAKEANPTARDYILVALLTGQRKQNTLAMKWTELDLRRGTWKIPDTKNGEALTVPLHPTVVDLLKTRQTDVGGIYVFPGDGAEGHFADPKKAWRRVLARSGIADLRIHDLRRTFGSWQAATGANLVTIGKSLGHKSQQATAIYARLDLDPVRQSMDKAIGAMLSAANVSPRGEVVKLEKTSARR